MANICQAFARIVPRYEFHENQAYMIVEDLDATFGRTPLQVGQPQRPTYQTNQVYYQRRPCTCGNHFCSNMQRC